MNRKTIQQLIDACQGAGDAIFHQEFLDEAMHDCYAAVEAAGAQDAQNEGVKICAECDEEIEGVVKTDRQGRLYHQGCWIAYVYERTMQLERALEHAQEYIERAEIRQLWNAHDLTHSEATQHVRQHPCPELNEILFVLGEKVAA